MSDDWKNDRAEASMREQEAKNMAKAKEQLKTKIKTVKISVNTRENFDLDAVNNNGETVVESHGYMPHWVHGYNYGVFDLEIDNETGKILNWVPLTKEEIEKKIKDLE